MNIFTPRKSNLNFINIFTNKNEYNTIPLNIYQTWNTINLPPKMKQNVEKLKNDNSEFKHYLFDDNMCREFIKTHFNKDVLYTFDKLIPGAYKADLFRYCILYINGGIYLDIKYKCVNNFKFIYLIDKEYFVRDRIYNDNYGIFQALLICYPYNKILLKCIDDIINNVKNNLYLYNYTAPLMITGPCLMNNYFSKNTISDFKLNIESNNNNINYNSLPILVSYPEYRTEQSKSINKHYSKLYKEINIYNYYLLNSIKTSKFNYNLCNFIKKNDSFIIIAENNINKIKYVQFEINIDLNKINNDVNVKNNNIFNIKLFNYNNEIYYTGNIINIKDNTLSLSFNKYDINTKEFIPNIFSSDRYNIWSLFNYNNKIAAIYSWYPLNICNIDVNENKLTNIKYIYKLPEIFKNINDSTNGFNYNNEIWFVLQLHQMNDMYENYQHFFAVFDNNMNLIKYSELFKLANLNIEKCNGIIIENDNIILSYTIESNSYISKYNINNNILWYENDSDFSKLI